jgi:hypothetical protein
MQFQTEDGPFAFGGWCDGGKFRIVTLWGRLPETWESVQPSKVYPRTAKGLFIE